MNTNTIQSIILPSIRQRQLPCWQLNRWKILTRMIQMTDSSTLEFEIPENVSSANSLERFSDIVHFPPHFWLLCLLTICFNNGFTPITNFGQLFFVHKFNLSAETANLCTRCFLMLIFSMRTQNTRCLACCTAFPCLRSLSAVWLSIILPIMSCLWLWQWWFWFWGNVCWHLHSFLHLYLW